MQPQDDNMPQDQTMGGGQSANVPASDQSSIMGGATFQPQASPQSSTPSWQSAAASDAQELYSNEQKDSSQPSAAMPPNPLLSDNPPQPATPPVNEAMNQDFNNQAAGLVATSNAGASQESTSSTPMPPNPLMAEAQTPIQSAAINEASAATPQPMQSAQTPIEPAPMSPVPPTPTPTPTPVVPPTQESMNPAGPTEPMPSPAMAETAPPLPPDMSQGPLPNQEPAQQVGLPGADQLGMAAAGMDQQAANAPLQMGQPLPQGSDMGVYGPPPRNNKKILFIIIGAVLGLVLIVVAVILISNSTRKKQTNQTVTTNTPQQQPTQTTTPSSGPATPPQGYVTIDKQCYTFALFNPNTVPNDQACSFDKATFGNQKTSTISVITTTDTLKSIDDYFTLVKQNVTLVSEESTKLDKLDAKQIIYKASDGKTYSEVAALIVGKNYQQDGKSVTAISIKTSYQISFDQEVTKNVIDTWRWK